MRWRTLLVFLDIDLPHYSPFCAGTQPTSQQIADVIRADMRCLDVINEVYGIWVVNPFNIDDNYYATME